MYEDRLRNVLKQQFYAFLNLALRNLWIVSKKSRLITVLENFEADFSQEKLTEEAYRDLLKGLESRDGELRDKPIEPKSLRERQSQINSFFHTVGLGEDMYCSEGGLVCRTYRARELRDLISFLAHKVPSHNLKKLAEKKLAEKNYDNLKVRILTLGPIGGRSEGFRIVDLLKQNLSYRKRISRALQVLVEIGLLRKEKNRYYHTRLGTEVAWELEYSLNRWIGGQLYSLLTYFTHYSHILNGIQRTKGGGNYRAS